MLIFNGIVHADIGWAGRVPVWLAVRGALPAAVCVLWVVLWPKLRHERLRGTRAGYGQTCTDCCDYPCIRELLLSTWSTQDGARIGRLHAMLSGSWSCSMATMGGDSNSQHSRTYNINKCRQICRIITSWTSGGGLTFISPESLTCHVNTWLDIGISLEEEAHLVSLNKYISHSSDFVCSDLRRAVSIYICIHIYLYMHMDLFILKWLLCVYCVQILPQIWIFFFFYEKTMRTVMVGTGKDKNGISCAASLLHSASHHHHTHPPPPTGDAPKTCTPAQKTRQTQTLSPRGGNLYRNRLEYFSSIFFLLCCFHYASSCYVYPPDVQDPCADKQCSFGAMCKPSLDGLTARCQCPQRCSNYGDDVDSVAICGTDGKDYDNKCEMRRAACRDMMEIEVKYEGRCGK